jgi:hypothetical protein
MKEQEIVELKTASPTKENDLLDFFGDDKKGGQLDLDNKDLEIGELTEENQ